MLAVFSITQQRTCKQSLRNSASPQGTLAEEALMNESSSKSQTLKAVGQN